MQGPHSSEPGMPEHCLHLSLRAGTTLSHRGGHFPSSFQAGGDLLEARMPSINSCRVIFPSWSLSMRRKKSMTRDFLWFIQRIYFFRQTSKSKFANSFNWKETRESQRGKSPKEQHPRLYSTLKHQPSGEPVPELQMLTLTARPPGKVDLGLSRQPLLMRRPLKSTFQNRRTHRVADSHHVDCASRNHRHGMQHPPRWYTDTYAEISATCTQTHTHPVSARAFGDASSPQISPNDSPGSA